MVWMTEKMRDGEDRRLFLPGATTSGHHQIELACDSCHTESFADRDAMQSACEGCHLEQLKAAKDDHPKTKFTDPRNADRVALLDARFCVTCHVEHRPDITLEMGVTQPVDYCFICHEDIAEDRPSHAGMSFETCASAGCHNFHDNRALYEDFLIKHLDEPDFLEVIPQTSKANLLEVAPVMGEYPLQRFPFQAIGHSDADAPRAHQDALAIDEWLASKHAHSGVNCSGCHSSGDSSEWVNAPDHNTCRTCHQVEVDSFVLGKHGMRLDKERLGKDLGPMQPKFARLPMHESATDLEIGCSTCHRAHRYDVVQASIDGCLGCHGDEHSMAFKSSPHYVGENAQEHEHAEWPGLTCASCHMPMVEKEFYWGEVIWRYADHNQSANFLPNEKMIRPVCMNCHGLAFTLDALADVELVNRNFSGSPSAIVQSMELARARIVLEQKAKEAAAKAAKRNPDSSN